MLFKSVLFIVPFFLLNLAGKCDTYIQGAVWIHKSAGNDEPGAYAGCRKGCFDNGTVNDNGVVKCEKCSAIEDQQFCEDHSDTCTWTTGGKCRSASCPSMVKNLNKARGRSRLLKECLEGDAETKYYNSLYLNSLDNNVTVEYPTGYPNLTKADLAKKICERNYDDLRYYTRLKNTIELHSAIDPYWLTNFYGSAEAEVNHWRAAGLANCSTNYDAAKASCVNSNGYKMQVRYHADTKAARKGCHRVYGCMYSADQSRCSVWAVWAFVLMIVLCVVVFVGGLGAGFFVFKGKLGRR